MATESRQLLLLPPVRPLSERLGHGFFRSIPEGPGVYFLCGPGDGILYVGKAKNLRRRLGSYRSAHTDRVPRKIRRLLNAVVRIHWDECPDEAAALEREAELIRTLKPRFNTAGVRPAPRLELGWNAGPGALDLAIGLPAADLPGRSGPVGRAPVLYAPLVRLAWGAAHPAVPLADMPAVLRGHRPPAALRFPLALPGLGELLAGFLGGTVPDLPARLVEWRGSAVPFEVSWQRRDRERLDELHAALASAKGLGPAPAAVGGDVADVVPDGGAV